jgi:hypothetical protein
MQGYLKKQMLTRAGHWVDETNAYRSSDCMHRWRMDRETFDYIL